MADADTRIADDVIMCDVAKYSDFGCPGTYGLGWVGLGYLEKK